MPLLPLWLKLRGLSDFQISLVYAIPVILRALFTPGMTFLADWTGRPVRLLYWLAWGALACILILPLTDGFPAIFCVVLLFTLFWMSVIPITDTIALAGARLAKADYGRMRLWGSLGYIAMTLAGGVAVDFWGAEAALWLFVAASVCVVIAAHWLPRDEDSALPHTPLGEAVAKPRIRFADALLLARAPNLWLFLAVTSAIQSAHAVYYIFGTLHWTAAGISPAIIGSLWSIGVIAEIVFFAYGALVSRFFSPVQLMVAAALAAVLRWTVTAYDPPLAGLFAVQILHGLTFGAAHLGAMQFITQAFPATLAASAQGLYASITAGVAMGLVSLAAGPLYRTLSGGAYLAMAALAFLGLLMALLLLQRWQGEMLVPHPPITDRGIGGSDADKA